MIIRHAEKAGPASTTQIGVDENGSPDKHSLSIRGWQRAGALVAFFASPTRPGVAKPKSIVAAASGDDVGIADEESKSRRAQQTVAPLHVRIGGNYRNDIATGDEDILVERLRGYDGAALVGWTHKRIHNIAAGFVESVVPEWDDDRFDLVWIIDRSPNGTYRLNILNQDLLAGDRQA